MQYYLLKIKLTLLKLIHKLFSKVLKKNPKNFFKIFKIYKLERKTILEMLEEIDRQICVKTLKYIGQ